MYDFRFPKVWLAIGWFGIALLIYLSLATLDIDTGNNNGDKLGHLLAYGLLMGWFALLYRNRKLLLLHAAGLIALGVVLEFLQQMTGRHFEYADMLANTLGVGLGLLLTFVPLTQRLLRLEQIVLNKET